MADLNPLTELMLRLRDPDSGCPWDLKQTHQSIARYTLEETYELLHALHIGDTEEFKKELGDLLFHIVFHAQIACENGEFCIQEVIDGIVEKMIRRHPHVFDAQKDNKLSEQALDQQWNEIKQLEKPRQDDFSSIGEHLPALLRAKKLQDEAAKYHFDWPDAQTVLEKIEEELAEFRQALQQNDPQAMQSELGDLLFACTNLARHADIDTEEALRQTNEKFIKRFDFVRQQMKHHGEAFSPEQLDTMERFWQQSKSVVG